MPVGDAGEAEGGIPVRDLTAGHALHPFGAIDSRVVWAMPKFNWG